MISKYKKCVLFFLVALYVTVGYAQVRIQSAEDASNETQEVPNTNVPAEEESSESNSNESEDELNNIRESIRVSSNFDLYYWLESLGLDTLGSKKQRQQRLLEYYDIDSKYLLEKKKTSSAASKYSVESDKDSTVKVERKNTIVDAQVSEIIIQNAEKLEYFTVEQIDEDIFVLLGNVVMLVTEEDKKKQYKIQAEKITYNETLRRGSAEGNVIFEEFEYTESIAPKEPKGKPLQIFNSHILVFDIDTFSTDVVLGNTTTEKEVKYGKNKDKKATLQFIIYSPHISNSTEEVIVAENVNFTTDKSSRPIYRIALQKMWLLAPNEWVISDGVVYMGNIPVMWIPFFFNPGDKFFFHPAIGLNFRTGAFINTTTYFIGDSSKEVGSEAFLDIFDFGSKKADRKVIKGLFLKEAEPGDVIYTYPKDWLLRLIVDYYTNLGAQAALKGKFTKVPLFKSIAFETGIASTQSIFKGKGDKIYFTHYLNDKNVLTSNLDSGYFFNMRIPFRYHINIDTSFDFHKSITSSLKFRYYSDAYILRDFSVRQFDFTWRQIFDPNFDKKNINKRSPALSSFYWKMVNNITVPLDKDFFGNYLKKLSLSNILIQANWNRKKTKKSSLPLAYSKGPGTIDQKTEGYFFYPSRFDVPSYKVSMAGTLLDYTFNNEKKNNETDSEKKDADDSADSTDTIHTSEELIEKNTKSLNDDTEKQVSESSVSSETDNQKDLLPYPKISIDTRKITKHDFSEVSGKFKYSITHFLSEQLYTNNTDKDRPESYDFLAEDFIDYGLLTTDNTFKVDNSFAFLAEIFEFSNNLTLNLKYKNINRDYKLSPEKRKKLKISNDKYTTEDLLSDNEVSLFYFKMLPYFSSSKLQYSASFFVSRHLLSTYKESEYIDLEDKKWWKEHNVKGSIVYKYSFISQTFSIKANIPPLIEKNTLSYTLGTFFSSLSSSISFVKRAEDFYEKEPWESNLSVFFFDKKLKFSQKQTYNVEDAYWKTVSSNLKLWWFTSKLTFKHEYNYMYEIDTASFEKKEDKRLRPDAFSANINYIFKDYWLWYNRIRTNFKLKMGYSHDFKKFINNKFTLSYAVNFFIHEILAFTIDVAIKNNRTFTYFSIYAEQIGLEEPNNIFSDIIDGLSIWDEEKTRGSFFELDYIKLSITQDFGGWVFNFSYNGKPKLQGSGINQNYKWESIFEINVLWKPLPEFANYVYYRDGAWSLEEEIKK